MQLYHFGAFGGRYLPEMLIPALDELSQAYDKWKHNERFQQELHDLYRNYSGRPTPLYFAQNLTQQLKGAKIYLKQEGLGQTGSYKINNALGQALLAHKMGKRRIIAGTAGQHGLATATVAAKFGFDCTIYMGERDVMYQAADVFWMRQLGAQVTVVTDGAKIFKDAVSAALKDWMWNLTDSYFLFGSTIGPHPCPTIVSDFQAIIGVETKQQLLQQEGQLPDYLIACVGSGSNAMGFFKTFLDEAAVKLIGVEAGGKGMTSGGHAACFQGGRLGVMAGYKSYFLQNDDGQIMSTHSISPGLDYAGVGPQLALLHQQKRIHFTYATDDEAVTALRRLAQMEGILSALESAHAVAHAIKQAEQLPQDKIIVVNLSGRGDKDIFILADYLNDQYWQDCCVRYGQCGLSEANNGYNKQP